MPLTCTQFAPLISPALVKNASASQLPATPLATQLREAKNCASASNGSAVASSAKAGDLAVNFAMLQARQAREALFANGSEPKAATNCYLKSNNRYACEEVTQFAKVYHQLQLLPLSSEDSQQLDSLAKQYVDKMVKDGLGEKSGFGAWTNRTDACYQQRGKLEHALAELATKVCGDKPAALGDSLLPAATQFILSSLEARLGRSLDSGSCQNVMGLIDSIADKSLQSLRDYRAGLLNEQGTGLGKLSRDLDTVAILPELLRKLLPELAKQLQPEGPQHGPDAPAPSGEPVSPPADGAAKPPSSPGTAGASSPPSGITINVGGIYIGNGDRRQYTFSSAATPPGSANASATANAEASSGGVGNVPADGVRSSASRLNHALQQVRMHQPGQVSVTTPPAAQGATITQPATTAAGNLHSAARDVMNQLSEVVGMAFPSAATPPEHVTPSSTGPVTAESAGAQQSAVSDAGAWGPDAALAVISTPVSEAGLGGRRADGVDWDQLRLQGKWWDVPNENVLKGADFKQGDQAAWELMRAARGVLAPAPTLSVTQRTAYDRWLNQLLPQKISANEKLPSGHDQAQLTRISGLLQHSDVTPFYPRLQQFAMQLDRLTNLSKSADNPVIRALMDGLKVGTKSAVATPVAGPQAVTAQLMEDQLFMHAAVNIPVPPAKPQFAKPLSPTRSGASASDNSKPLGSVVATPFPTGSQASRVTSTGPTVTHQSTPALAEAGDVMTTSTMRQVVPHALVTGGEGRQLQPPLLTQPLKRVRLAAVPSANSQGQADARRELVDGLRMLLQPSVAERLATSRPFESWRESVLPADPAAFDNRLVLLKEPGHSPAHQQLEALVTLMKGEHFRPQRGQAISFAQQLIRKTDLLKGDANWMIDQLLEGVGITPERIAELKPKKSDTAPQGRVILTVDGVHHDLRNGKP